MSEYLRQVRGFRRDIHLFLVYNLLVYVGWGVFTLIFNLYCTALHLREDDIGAFNAAQTVAMAAGAVTLGPIIGRFGIWRSIVGGMAIFLAASTGLALAERPTALLALSALSGFGVAYFSTTTMPFVIEWTRAYERQHVSAITYAIIGLAGTLGSLLGGLLPAVVGLGPVGAYRITLLAGTVVAGVSLVPLAMMGAPRRGAAPPDATALPEATEAKAKRQVRRDMGAFILVGGLMALGAGAVIPFYNVYLTTLGASAEQVGYVFALAGLGAATIGLAAPAVTRRFGALWGGIAVRLAGVPLFLVLLAAPTLPVAVLAYITRQTTVSMAWPIDSTFIADVLPPRARTAVFGYRSAAWNAGWALASLVGGVAIVRFGYDVTFLAIAFFMVLAMVVFAAYFLRHPRVQAGEIPSALPRGRRQEAARQREAETVAALVGAPIEPEGEAR
ncbi:MAG TPA: MFS transporter [Thermomicrobiales bacterium]|nr:MFS transporter [Thermomicrobiales bacterium]